MDRDQWTPNGQNPRNDEDNAMDLFFGLEDAKTEPAEEPVKEPPKAESRPEEMDRAGTQRVTVPAEKTSGEVKTPPRQENRAESRPQSRPQPAKEAPPRRTEQETVWSASPMDEVEKPREKEPKENNNTLRNLLIIAGVAVAAIAIVVFVSIEYVRYGKKSNNNSSVAQSSESSEEELPYDGQELYGVIESVNTAASQVTVYNAETKSTTVFDMNAAQSITDPYGTEISISGLHRGQIVNVQYNASNNEVALFRITSQATEVKDITDAVVQNGLLLTEGETYVLDDHLICLYQGEEYDTADLNGQQAVTLMMYGDHVYTIYVTRTTGQLRLENCDAFQDGSITITSELGAKSEPIQITGSTVQADVLEGTNTVTVTQEGTTVYTARVFVAGNETQTLTLPESSDKQGSVKLVISPETASVTIDGQYYAAGETIDLDYGQHELSASASGYTTVTRTITIGQPYQRVVITMTNSQTAVSINSAYSGSAVYINGNYRGTAPLRVMLEPGTYQVRVSTPGYQDSTMTVTVSEGELEKVVYFSDFVPEESSAPEESSESSVEESSSESSVEESSSESSVEESSSESSVEESSSVESSVESSESSEASSVPETPTESSVETAATEETSE